MSSWERNGVWGELWDAGSVLFLVLDADCRDVFILCIKLYTYYLCTFGV